MLMPALAMHVAMVDFFRGGFSYAQYFPFKFERFSGQWVIKINPYGLFINRMHSAGNFTAVFVGKWNKIAQIQHVWRHFTVFYFKHVQRKICDVFLVKFPETCLGLQYKINTFPSNLSVFPANG